MAKTYKRLGSVVTTIDILDCVADLGPICGTKCAAALEMSRMSVMGYLETLADTGVLRRVGGSEYEIGLKTAKYWHRFREREKQRMAEAANHLEETEELRG